MIGSNNHPSKQRRFSTGSLPPNMVTTITTTTTTTNKKRMSDEPLRVTGVIQRDENVERGPARGGGAQNKVDSIMFDMMSDYEHHLATYRKGSLLNASAFYEALEKNNSELRRHFLSKTLPPPPPLKKNESRRRQRRKQREPWVIPLPTLQEVSDEVNVDDPVSLPALLHNNGEDTETGSGSFRSGDCILPESLETSSKYSPTEQGQWVEMPSIGESGSKETPSKSHPSFQYGRKQTASVGKISSKELLKYKLARERNDSPSNLPPLFTKSNSGSGKYFSHSRDNILTKREKNETSSKTSKSPSTSGSEETQEKLFHDVRYTNEGESSDTGRSSNLSLEQKISAALSSHESNANQINDPVDPDTLLKYAIHLAASKNQNVASLWRQGMKQHPNKLEKSQQMGNLLNRREEVVGNARMEPNTINKHKAERRRTRDDERGDDKHVRDTSKRRIISDPEGSGSRIGSTDSKSVEYSPAHLLPPPYTEQESDKIKSRLQLPERAMKRYPSRRHSLDSERGMRSMLIEIASPSFSRTVSSLGNSSSETWSDSYDDWNCYEGQEVGNRNGLDDAEDAEDAEDDIDDEEYEYEDDEECYEDDEEYESEFSASDEEYYENNEMLYGEEKVDEESTLSSRFSINTEVAVHRGAGSQWVDDVPVWDDWRHFGDDTMQEITACTNDPVVSGTSYIDVGFENAENKTALSPDSSPPLASSPSTSHPHSPDSSPSVPTPKCDESPLTNPPSSSPSESTSERDSIADSQKSSSYVKEAMSLLKLRGLKGTTEEIVHVLDAVSSIHRRQRKYSRAIDCYEAKIEFLRKRRFDTKVERWIGETLCELGFTCKAMGEYKDAVSYFHGAFEVLGNIPEDKDNIDDDFYFCLDAERISEMMKCLAFSYLATGDQLSALKYFSMSLGNLIVVEDEVDRATVSCPSEER